MEFIIITGMSGSGKSAAINALEDIGFFCVDNMPPQLMAKFVQISADSTEIRKIAFGCDIRGAKLTERNDLAESAFPLSHTENSGKREMFSNLRDAIFELKHSGVTAKVLFMDASDEVIKRRYKETRRLHPLHDASGGEIDIAIQKERELLSPIIEIADYTLDTGLLTTAELKNRVLSLFMDNVSDSMLIKCASFGFKYGIPGDADLVFDVRFLANPFYVSELKHKTGLDKEVRDFVMKGLDAQESEQRLFALIDFLIPRYVAEGKSQLVIAFGCTGGKHRSVTFAERLYGTLSEREYKVAVFHRDIEKSQSQTRAQPKGRALPVPEGEA
jgi:UPF0042 nucleotide-binding protein